MKRRVIEFGILLLVFGLLLAGLQLLRFGSLTGFAVYSDSSQSNFDSGTYSKTIYNGSAIVLNNSLQGNFTSRVFDAGAEANWSNVSFSGARPSIELLFAVDSTKAVYYSNNSGLNWSNKTNDYGGGLDTTNIISDGSYLYIIFNGGKQIFRSGDLGVTWTVVNNTLNVQTGGGINWLATGANISGGGLLYIIDGNQKPWKSSDYGVSWTNGSDFNGVGANDVKGMAVNSTGAVYVVDGSGAVYVSLNAGTTWTQKNSSYGGTTGTDAMAVDSSGNVYILLNKDIYKSTNSGVGWSVVNATFTSNAQDGVYMFGDTIGKIYIIDNSGRFFSSSNGGDAWTQVGDINSVSSSAPKGLTNYIVSTNLTYQVRNCSSSNCADGTFRGSDGTGNTYYVGTANSLELRGRYFQYKFFFSTPDSAKSSYVINTSIGYQLVNTAPSVSLIKPSQGDSYGISSAGSLSLNYTVSDSDNNLQACWYNINSGANTTLNNCANTTFSISSNGNYTLYLYANDTQGLKSMSSASFSVFNSAPSVNIVRPAADDSYGSNNSLALNYTVSDSDNNLQSCWYHINSGANNTLANCANTTFGVAGSGSYTLYLYANDSQGAVNRASVSFSVTLGAPTISLSTPINGTYLNSGQNINFVYTATDTDLNSCSLWGNFNGTFSKNQTHSSVVSGVQHSFGLNLSDGTYSWNVFCNDTAGNGVFNGNKTFFVDTVSPSISLSEPSGTKTSRTGIPLTFSLTENNKDSCIYNVYRGTSVEVANTTVNCNLGGVSFNVTLDADFVLNFYANDSAGNSGRSSSSFTVDTAIQTSPTSDGSSGGGGGGGGGGIITSSKNGTLTRNLKVEFSNLNNLIYRRGTSNKIIVEAKNNEIYYLNKCSLTGGGETGVWIKSEGIGGLSPGEKLTYEVSLNIPDSAAPGVHTGSVILNCEEGKSTRAISVTVYRANFDFKVDNYSRDGNYLVVNYAVQEFSNEDHNIIIDYQFIDFDNVTRKSGQERIVLAKGYKGENVLKFELPKDSFGQFELLLSFSDGISKTDTSEKIFLPSGAGATGFAISAQNKSRISIFGLIIILITGLVLMGRFVYKRYKRANLYNSLFRKEGRQHIKLDMSEWKPHK